MSTELLAACDEIEVLAANVDKALAELEAAPEPNEAFYGGLRKHAVATSSLHHALRRAIDLGLIAAARRGVEAQRDADALVCSCLFEAEEGEAR